MWQAHVVCLASSSALSLYCMQQSLLPLVMSRMFLEHLSTYQQSAATKPCREPLMKRLWRRHVGDRSGHESQADEAETRVCTLQNLTWTAYWLPWGRSGYSSSSNFPRYLHVERDGPVKHVPVEVRAAVTGIQVCSALHLACYWFAA